MGKKKKKAKKEPEITIAKRFQRDLDELAAENLTAFQDFKRSPDNPLHFSALICPEYPPYNEGVFRIEIFFPIEFPFKPPRIVFRTKIYHPNIDEKGQVSFPIIWSEKWKPTTTIVQVIQALIALVQDPVIENRIRVDVANEFMKDKNKFMQTAQEYTRKFSEPKLPVIL